MIRKYGCTGSFRINAHDKTSLARVDEKFSASSMATLNSVHVEKFFSAR